jgi:glucosylceramidase
VFWRGSGGRIFESWYDRVWHRPVDLGWRSSSAPAAGIARAGRQYVFWLSANGDIDEAWYGGGWHGPRDLTTTEHWGGAGRASAAPAVAAEPDSARLYLYWRDRGGRLRRAWYAGGWHGPADTGWSGASAPAAAITRAGHQYVFWQGRGGYLDESLLRTSWIGPLSRWSVRSDTGPYVEAVQTTADMTQRMTPLSDPRFTRAPPSAADVIAVDDSVRYQQVTGVGGAMTDSAAWLIYDELEPSARATLIDDLFGADGIHLNYTILPIGGSDFTASRVPYTYDDLPAGQTDPQLAHFSIAHDQSYIIPTLRRMLAVNPHVQVLAVPWTAPPWMKANDAFDATGGHATLLASDYGPWAQYFVRFLQAYAAAGVRISAIAPENEPNSGSPFPAMMFPSSAEGQWITEDLEPALAASKLTPRVYGGDIAWGSTGYAPALLSTPAGGVLAGIAWHCYGGAPGVMTTLHEADPSLDQPVAECAPNLSRFPVPEIVIGAIRNWASAVTLWNLALDPSGGPVQPPNLGCPGCRGLVTINEATHSVTFTLPYYQLGQVGAFVEPHAWRVSSNSFVSYFDSSSTSYGATAGVDDVAFLNPDGSRILVAYNTSSVAIRFAVAWRGRAFAYSLAPGATVTFRWEAPSAS